MDTVALENLLSARDEPSYRATQVWKWAARGAVGFEEMTDLPAELRRELAARLPYSTLTLENELRSVDGTLKALFSTVDGRPLEAVLMSYRDGRRSLCVSSQSGCPLTCTFCATGSMAFGRNLTADEIVDQALHFRRLAPVNHCVFMGMGEPLMNLDAVLEACSRLPDIGIASSNTAISTVGWVPGIKALTESRSSVRLALSLHAPSDELRSQIMPVNDRHPIAEVLAACEAHFASRNRQIFVEYLMLSGVNDSIAQADQLAGLLDRRVYKLNLIPYNPTDAAYEGSGRPAIDAFKARLESKGIRATVRLTRGQDIAAACGQLAAKTAS